MRAYSPFRLSCGVVVGLLVFVFVFVARAGALAAVGSIDRASVAATTQGDQVATHMLLAAEYRLAKATLVRGRAIEVAVTRAAENLGRECRGVLGGVPDESMIGEEVPSAPRPRLSGRVQGERARSEREKQTIDLEVSEATSTGAYRVVRGPYEAFIATADRLTWSDPTINALVHQKTVRFREDLSGPLVAVCAEMRAWKESGFHVLPPGSTILQEDREARDLQTAQGGLGVLLRPYEDRADRTIVGRTTALKERLREEERADEGLSRVEYHMELALGEKVSRFVEQRSAPVIGKGRTSAGTTFVIRASVGKGSRGSCRHEVDVEISKGRDGSASNVCLSEGTRPHPSSSCSGSMETIELATLPDVGRARVRLSDGRIATVSVMYVPAKYGGPAGVLIDAFRGYQNAPVSVRELSRDGRVVHIVDLSGVRCTRRLAAEAPGPPQFVSLATVRTPSGEPLTIQGMLHRVGGQAEFSLTPPPSIRNSEASEERGKPKQFQWELSTECAPHPYSLIDGILLPPGAFVLARTPAGLAPLTKVELAASMHAGGPLFYGVYPTPLTEIVIERSDGSVLYAKSLAAKATEETEFCEGYANGE